MPFEVVYSLTLEQVTDLMDLYQHTYWAQERRREDVESMLSDSDYIFGVVEEGTGRLRAFTRVLTDKVYRAVVFDVVVHPEFRGRGLAKMVFDAMVSHPVLGKVENIVLYCKGDVIELYKKWGFTDESDGMCLMFWRSRS